MIHLQTLDCSSNEAIAWLQQQLHTLGLTSLISFDSRTMRHGQGSLPCPQHGHGRCDCQMIVFLVYGSDPQPATLVLHGSSGLLTLSLVDTPQQRPLPQLRALLYQNFQPEPNMQSIEAVPPSRPSPTRPTVSPQKSASSQS